MRHSLFILVLAGLLLVSWLGPARADCPGNLLVNPGFEEGDYKTERVGTSLSSNLGNGWTPWSILGGATHNREVEYKVLDTRSVPDPYRVHSGNRSQKFFTTWATHAAGFYQRVKVAPGSQVTFSIWVQIYTGEREIKAGGNYISDLEWPSETEKKRGPGLYRVYVGIDPTGQEPRFGTPPPDSTVWSAPVVDAQTRVTTTAGVPFDAWVQLSVSTVAQSEYVTVYTKGQPEYAVKHNDSFWDDACLLAQAPSTATRRPTSRPSATSTLAATATAVPPTATALSPTPAFASPTPTPSLLATSTMTATATLTPTHTLTPTMTASATLQPTATATPTPQPTASPLPQVSTTEAASYPSPVASGLSTTITPSPTGTPAPAPDIASGSTTLLMVYGTAILLLLGLMLGLRLSRRR